MELAVQEHCYHQHSWEPYVPGGRGGRCTGEPVVAPPKSRGGGAATAAVLRGDPEEDAAELAATTVGARGNTRTITGAEDIALLAWVKRARTSS